jgi:hypothetical protein
MDIFSRTSQYCLNFGTFLSFPKTFLVTLVSTYFLAFDGSAQVDMGKLRNTSNDLWHSNFMNPFKSLISYSAFLLSKD